MKKFLFILSLMVLALSFQVSTGSAQTSSATATGTTSYLVATVNIYNATNTKINDNTYSISFQLENRVGVQSDIRYGIKLVNAKTRETTDLNLANQALTLKAGETKNITLQYTVPGFIPNGEYSILITSQTSNGIILATSPIGFPQKNITITNHNQGADIQNCYLTVTDDATSTHYSASQGVDILPTEVLQAHCQVSNNGASALNNLNFQLITHERGQFGDIVANNTLSDNISLPGNSKKDLTFTIPTVKNPQAYDIDAFLVDSAKAKVSVSTYLHYVIAGPSATIQNTVLDKTDYKKGDTAHLTFFWSPAADTFPGSRLGGTSQTYKVKSTITDSTGKVCAETESSLTNSDTDFGQHNLELTITQDCSGAIAKTEIVDNNDQVLAENNINPNNPAQTVKVNPGVTSAHFKTLGINKFYVVLFIVVLVLLGYGILVFKKSHQGETKDHSKK